MSSNDFIYYMHWVDGNVLILTAVEMIQKFPYLLYEIEIVTANVQ